MLLDQITDSLSAKTLEAIATNDLQAYVQFHDDDKFLVDVQGRVKKKTAVNDVLNRIMEQPTANTTNEVANLLEPKMISIANTDTISHTLVLSMTDTTGTTLDVELYRAFLLANEKIEWTPEDKWQIYDAKGLKKNNCCAKGSIATLANVASSATSVTILVANAQRVSATIVNDSAQVLYLKYGATASSTSFTHKLAAGESKTINEYTGLIDGIWASASGFARTTEVTP